MMGYRMSEQAASLRMPLYICLQAEFAHDSIYYVNMSTKPLRGRYWAVLQRISYASDALIINLVSVSSDSAAHTCGCLGDIRFWPLSSSINDRARQRKSHHHLSSWHVSASI